MTLIPAQQVAYPTHYRSPVGPIPTHQPTDLDKVSEQGQEEQQLRKVNHQGHHPLQDNA